MATELPRGMRSRVMPAASGGADGDRHYGLGESAGIRGAQNFAQSRKQEIIRSSQGTQDGTTPREPGRRIGAR
jgi:hypothetical protein